MGLVRTVVGILSEDDHPNLPGSSDRMKRIENQTGVRVAGA